MANTGDSYIVQIKTAHLMWGEYHPSRHGIPGDGRMEIYGEGYIKIPANEAYRLGIMNQNNNMGIHAYYNCDSYDGFYQGLLLAQGNQSDPNYAKQFSQHGCLKAIGDWYDYVGAVDGDYVKVRFTSQDSIIIEHSKTRTGFHI
jgi:hypothetical protein